MTDGFQLTVIEWKSGLGKPQEDFQKLNNLVSTLGGSFGRGLYVAGAPPTNIAQRIQGAKVIMAGIFNQAVDRLEELCLTAVKGSVHR